MTDRTAIAIVALRAEFSKIKTIDPDGAAYKGLCAILDRADDAALKACHEAKIPFVSKLAWNRMFRRGLVKVAI